MSVALGIVISLVALASIVVVIAAFVWAARKDGEENEALQKRLGIRRKPQQ